MAQYGWNKELNVSVLEKIRSDLKNAMLKRDDDVRSALRMIMSEFPKVTVPIQLEDGKKTTRPKTAAEITDDDVHGVIRGLVKSEKTVLELTRKASSPYLEILESYLPKMAGRDDIVQWISENIDFSKMKSAAQAMGPIMKHFGKLADGNLVKQILQEMTQKTDA